eukprot:154504_1
MSASLEPIPFVDWENQITPFKQHTAFRIQCRKFTDEILLPNINKWEKEGTLPLWAYKKAYEYGVYTPDYPNEYGGQRFQNEPFDYFMDIIRQDEMGRAGSGGLFTAMYTHKISVPPVIEFGTEEQKKLFIPVCRGDKIAALAISEPGHGSDVAGLKCSATRKRDASTGEEYFEVNGMKKWISNGMKCDYYTTAVRTGGEGTGLRGISLLIIPGAKYQEKGRVITSRIKTQGHKCSETAMIIFRGARAALIEHLAYEMDQTALGKQSAMLSANVCLAKVNADFYISLYINYSRAGHIPNHDPRTSIIHRTMQCLSSVTCVPVSNLVGAENAGFNLIMYNFNQERFGIACQALQLARVALKESVAYAKQRKTFGKALIQHQVIRHKIAEMGRQIMATFCFMERLAFALQRDPLGRKDKSIPANIALLKVQATRTLEFCAREGSQIFGGASYVEGKIIDRIYRDVRAFAIYGGSEEIMLDVSTRLSKL